MKRASAVTPFSSLTKKCTMGFCWPDKLDYGREGATAVAVPESFFKC